VGDRRAGSDGNGKLSGPPGLGREKGDKGFFFSTWNCRRGGHEWNDWLPLKEKKRGVIPTDDFGTGRRKKVAD